VAVFKPQSQGVAEVCFRLVTLLLQLLRTRQAVAALRPVPSLAIQPLEEVLELLFLVELRQLAVPQQRDHLALFNIYLLTQPYIQLYLQDTWMVVAAEP
jgi:hypothetical protein